MMYCTKKKKKKNKPYIGQQYYHSNGKCYQQPVAESIFPPHPKQLKVLIFLKAEF